MRTAAGSSLGRLRGSRAAAAATWTLLTLLALSGHARADAVPAMEMGQGSAPPQAFLDYCRTAPAYCGLDAAGRTAEQISGEINRRFWTAVKGVLRDQQQAEAEEGAAASLGPPAGAGPTAAEQAARPAAFTAGRAVTPILAPQPLAWSGAPRRLVEDVNRRVNGELRQQPDIVTYRRNDVWRAPSLVGDDRFGDCEDYVLKKRELLMDAGVPASALSIALVVTSWGERHAVLLVATNQGEVVLDNLTDRILPWAEANLTWEFRQLPASPFSWTALAPAQAAARSRPAPPLVVARLDREPSPATSPSGGAAIDLWLEGAPLSDDELEAASR